LVRLPNRRGLSRDLDNLIARLNRYGGSAAMIFVDLDGLKQINDRYGHPTGDAALIRIAEILVENVRASDTVARLSGDEFIILLLDVDELAAWNMALRVVEATVASSVTINDHQVPLSVAVGVSTIGPGDVPDDVISRADKAMYRIKAA
jgi:diguanylate cyclase (GGDEF)-like protein